MPPEHAEALSPEDMPISLTQNEFMRRMTEMSKLSGGSNMFGGGFPMNYDVVINSNHPLSKKIIDDNHFLNIKINIDNDDYTNNNFV